MKTLVLFLVAVSLVSSLDAACPHLTVGLQSWKNASSWVSNAVPAAGANVVIPAGKKILLDVSPPELTSITIESGGQLVWSPAGDYEVRAKYILVKGRLDVGSEDCKFTRKAIITLVGNYGASPVVTGFGSKFLGVASGGSLELHGLDPSPSWTKLTSTVQSSVTLGSANMTTLGRGFNVAMYNAQGTLLGYQSFDFLGNVSFQTAFQTFLNSQPTGTIMAAAVSDALCPAAQILNATHNALATYGVTQFKSTGYRYSYAVIGVKGGSAVENYTANGSPSAFLARTFTYNSGSSSFQVRAQSKGYVEGQASFAKIEREFAGTVIINLLHNVTWKAGDRVVLAATDFSPYQSEEATLASCPECAKNQVKLTALPKYLHHGAIVDGVDERGEVGLLTRNILIRGAVQNACYGMAECAYIPDNIDLFGGQLKIVKGFTNVHIESVEFYKMGQQVLGSYPVHFHLCGDVDGKGNYSQPAYVKKSSIHRSLHRCVSIHGTNGLLFQDNVAYDHYGHCVFFEDGIETRNVVDRNLAMLTRFGTVIPTDRSCSVCTAMAPPGFGVPDCGECLALSTYWITNPDNVVTNNVAAGSEFVGFWYIFPERPTGLSEQLGLALKTKPAWTKMGLMENNTAHSNKGNGLHIDDGIKAGNQTAASPIQYLAKIGARYNPRVDFTNRASARAPAIISRYTAYKNRAKGAWVRGGDIWFQDSTFADGPIGLTLASEGAMPNDPGSHQAVVRSLFVGLTANKGQRVADLPWDPVLSRTHFGDVKFPIRGFEIYDGPLRVENNRFKNFLPDSRHNGSAFGNLLSDNWQVAPTNYAKASTFLDASRRLYHGLPSNYAEHDGDRNPVIMDLDGTISGVANSFIVADNPFFKSKNCTSKPDWDAAVCWAQKYGQLFIRNDDSARTNFSGITTGQVFYMTRDEYSSYPLGLEGIPSATPRIQFQPLVMLSKGYTAKFAYPTPPKLSFQLTNWNAGNWARIGVCYPPANFTVTKSVGTTTTALTPVNSIGEVNNSSSGSVYFYDTVRGILFFKAVAVNNRNGYNYCGSAGCETYHITAQGPQVGKSYLCTPYPTYAVTPA